MESILKSFDQFEFHDADLSALKFDFDKKVIEIEVGFYNDLVEDYDIKIFNFYEVSNISLDGIFSGEAFDMEVMHFEIDNDSADLLFISDLNSTESSMRFNFKKITITE